MAAEDDGVAENSIHIAGIEQHYETLDILGSGTYGKVYKCRSIEDGKAYAIKVVESKKRKNSTTAAQLRNEISIMSKLNHDNIVRINAVLSTGADMYIIMELCEGGELAEQFVRVSTGVYERWSEDDAAAVMKPLLSALDYLHSNNIAHRDVKPENILLVNKDDIGNIKLSDFGLSKRMNAEHAMEASCGTPHYIAPEVITDNNNPYDEKCDVWSAGVILFLMLTGRQPFNRTRTADMYDAIRKGAYTFPEDVVLSRGAKHLIRHLLQVDVRERYTAGQALEHPWLNGDVDAVPAPTITEMMRAIVARKNFRKIAFAVWASEILMAQSGFAKVATQEIADEFETAVPAYSKSDSAIGSLPPLATTPFFESIAASSGRPPRVRSARPAAPAGTDMSNGMKRKSRRLSEPANSVVDSLPQQPSSARGPSRPRTMSVSAADSGKRKRASRSNSELPSYMKATAASEARNSPTPANLAKPGSASHRRRKSNQGL